MERLMMRRAVVHNTSPSPYLSMRSTMMTMNSRSSIAPFAFATAVHRPTSFFASSTSTSSIRSFHKSTILRVAQKEEAKEKENEEEEEEVALGDHENENEEVDEEVEEGDDDDDSSSDSDSSTSSDDSDFELDPDYEYQEQYPSADEDVVINDDLEDWEEQHGHSVDQYALLPSAYTPKSYDRIARGAFPVSASKVLLAPLDPSFLEIDSNGRLFLPTVYYTQILNTAFGPGGWALMPRGPILKTNNVHSRDYALYALGQFLTEVTATASLTDTYDFQAAKILKREALTQSCLDIGVASEMLNPKYIAGWRSIYATSSVVHNRTVWTKKNAEEVASEAQEEEQQQAKGKEKEESDAKK